MSLFNKGSWMDGGLGRLKVNGISLDPSDLNPIDLVAPGLGAVTDLFSGGLQGGTSTQTTSADFNPTIKPFAEQAFTDLSKLSAPSFFPGQTLAPQSTQTAGGINALSDAVTGQQTIADTALGGFNFTLNDLLNPESNPALQAHIQGAINPIFDRLENVTLPGIGGQAVQAGQFGGTAQNNLVMQALEQAQRNAFDATGKISSDAFQTSLDNFTQTLLNAPSVQSALTQPARTQLTAGGLEEQRSQAEIDAERERFDFEQSAEFNFLQDYIGTLLGAPQTQTVTTQGADTSPLQFLASLAPVGLLAAGVPPAAVTAAGAVAPKT